MPGLGMMFTSSKTRGGTTTKKKTTTSITTIKPTQIGNNFMGLYTLKSIKPCQSCGHIR